jgi:hypothetical protein
MTSIPSLVEAYRSTVNAGGSRWFKPYRPADGSGHQFIFFIKPEATHAGVQLDQVLHLAFETLAQFHVEVGAIRLLSADYLKLHQIMDQHYGVINRISKQGVPAITEGAKAKLQDTFGELIEHGAPVLGGHQFLGKHPDFSPVALSVLNDNIGTTKLGGGTYALSLKVLGKPMILLNPFHPYQLVPFTTTGNGIIVMEGLSKTSWHDLRQKLTGSTNPLKASVGSLRHNLLVNKHRLGMTEVDQGNNGVHLSAGPLEGMVELRRFFSEPESSRSLAWTDTAFGRNLADSSHSAEQIAALAANPVLQYDGDSISAFDLTEEKNADEAIKRLAAAGA